MVYAPQRRHAVASLASTTQVLAVLQQLYTPNVLVLASRLLVQAQIAAAPFTHPTRSLLTLFFLLASMNASATFLHLLDFWAGMNGGKGVILDFVGQTYPAGLSRILILDILMFLLQLTSLVVSYTTNHGSHIPKSPLFAYDDILLPPSPAEVFHAKSAGDDEADLESGGLRRRRSRAGGYGVAEEIWLDDDDDEELGNVDDAEASSSTRLLDRAPMSPRRQEPPLIFSLSLSHLVNLVFRLPAPNPPRAFSGGTPDVSPLPTPGRRTVPLPLAVPASGASLQASTAGAASAPSSGTRGAMGATSAPLASAATPTPTTGSTDRALDTDAEPEWEDETSEDDEEAARSSRRHGRRAMGVMPDIGRIPGSYWTDRVNRGGGNG